MSANTPDSKAIRAQVLEAIIDVDLAAAGGRHVAAEIKKLAGQASGGA